MYPLYLSAERTKILNKNEEKLRNNMAAICTYLHFYDQHGIIKEITTNYQLSRNRFMRHVDVALNTFATNHAKEKEQIRSLKKEITRLQKQLNKQKELTNAIQSQLDTTTTGIKQRRIKLILLSAVLNNSFRDIASLVECAFGTSISHTKVQQIVGEFESKASDIMREYFAVGIETGCLDEIFFHQDPILVIVEALSHCIVAIEKKDSRSVADWESVISSLPFLERSVNDKGKGITGALGGCHIPYTVDFFHIIEAFQKAFRKLEKRTYALITQEEQIKKQLNRLAPYSRNRGKVTHLSHKLASVQRSFEKAAQTYDLVEWLIEEITRSFAWVKPDGTLNTEKELLGKIQILCEWLKELCPEIFRKAINYVNTPRVATFLGDLHQKLTAIDTTNPCNISHTTIVEHVGRLWVAAQKQPVSFPLLLQLQDRVLEYLLGQWEGYDTLKQKVFDAFTTTHRSSSAAECVNSRLRLYELVKKHVNQPFLSLAALYHNMTPFKDGAKRKGISPAQLLKLKLPGNDFFDILGLQKA